MSSKNTPANQRLNKILQSSSSTPRSNSTPNSIHKKVARPLFSTKLTDSISSDYNSATNTPFLPSTVTKTPVSSQKFKPKTSTTLNACYTPSSLYRSTKSTPRSALITPRGVTNHVTNNTPECSSKISNSFRRSENSTMEDSGVMSKSVKDIEISNLTVAVRVRPLNAQECTNPGVTNIVQVVGNEVTVYTGTTADNSAGVSHCFQYDQAFYSCNMDNSNYANQETVFNGTGMGLIDRAFEGYNTCLFAYGQTGSGKSYSMMGIEVDDSDDISTNTEAGIIPRFCHELFRRIESSKDKLQAEIEVSYFEIYNEKIHDLLCVSDHSESHSSGSHRNALKVREHPVWGPYVVDLSIHPVESYSALRNWLAVGNSQRATAATGMNDKSSRSHSIFNIVLNLSEIDSTTATEGDGKVKQTRRSKISLVDLAGSERITHTAGSNGDRVREGVSINKSLLTLGKVISKLAESKRQSNFVPYRESVLTWLLRESLGGNSKTLMLATISPASIHIDETLATLRYACQARTIINRVKVNEDPHDKIIRELRAEVERLQALRQDYERQKRHSASNNAPARKIIIETSVDESEVEALRQQLADTEKQLNRAQKSWMERLKEAEDQRKSEVRLLKRKGLAMELSAEQKQACLVNLAADPILSGTLFYILPPGTVKIGRTRTSIYCSQPDIVLDGPLVGYHHCTIENKTGKLYITPDNEEFETYLNGELVTGSVQMFHGDRLVIGGSHYFRISNPFCSKRRSKNLVVDFQLAHQEILQKQEQQLRRELDEEKRAALSQIELERVANERNYKERMEMLELEQFKFKCNKELLETEKKALKEEADDQFVYTPSYKSTLLDDINRIMQNPSEESLHKTQLMVKEATQRCRQLGLQLDFKQSQILDEFGFFHAVVLIIDREKKQKAEWPTARLDVWLNMLRDNEVDRNDVFKCVDIEWKSLEDNMDDTLSDSLNSSRISLNLSLVKEVMLKQPYQKFQNIFSSSNSSNKKENLGKSAVLNCSLRNTKKMLTYDEQDCSTPVDEEKPSLSPGLDFNASANVQVRDIHRSIMKLKKLCDRFSSDENNSENISKVATVEQVRKSIEQLEGILHGLKITLSESVYKEISPTKTPKSVRFLID
ncbi:kinesin-like protein KIF14 [Episyrphus balteatus]|uniref:kinesin-like protein KIF14 n=1 Tax=Episyrphus balteatus TaxID=286459 RepID=UPI002486A21F|nr:kinesin-like protein KIF14 [Episyrphus balteatus]